MEFLNKELQNKFGIYGIINNITGRTYIGQTSQNFKKRYWHHQWKLRDNSHDNQHLQNAWNLYGENSFSFIPLEVVNDVSKLDDLEIKYISIYRENNKCYNINQGGSLSRKGIPISDEHKRKISEKNRINMKGKKHSSETRRKMSECRKGKIHLNSKSLKLNPDLAFQIKTKLINGETAKKISDELNIDYKYINNIISNNAWSSIKIDGWDEYINSRKTYHRLNKEDHKEIFRLFSEEGYTKYQLAEMYNKGVKMIEKIIRDNKNSLYDNPVQSLT